jgi:hypothetical protein
MVPYKSPGDVSSIIARIAGKSKKEAEKIGKSS